MSVVRIKQVRQRAGEQVFWGIAEFADEGHAFQLPTDLENCNIFDLYFDRRVDWGTENDPPDPEVFLELFPVLVERLASGRQLVASVRGLSDVLNGAEIERLIDESKSGPNVWTSHGDGWLSFLWNIRSNSVDALTDPMIVAAGPVGAIELFCGDAISPEKIGSLAGIVPKTRALYEVLSSTFCCIRMWPDGNGLRLFSFQLTEEELKALIHVRSLEEAVLRREN
jgi:hypothetical protein